MDLTREEAIRLHREMWNYIAQEEKRLNLEPGIDSRYNLKDQFLKSKGIRLQDVYHSCFLCEYAIEQPTTVDNHCEYCPLDWGNPDESYPCEPEPCNEDKVGTRYDWSITPAEIIANLPEKGI